jgi:hypothetical protein
VGTRAGESLANGVGAEAEDLGDLARLHALDPDEQRDLSMRGGERCERAFECELGLRVGDRLERRALRPGGFLGGQVAGELRAHRLRAPPRLDEMVRDREQPRAEPGVGGETFRVLGQPEERLLEEILGGIAASGHPHEVTVEPAPVRGKHRIERGRIPPAKTGEPVGLGGERFHAGTTLCPPGRVSKFSLSRSEPSRVSPSMVEFFIAGGWMMFVITAIGVPLVVTAAKFARNANAHGLSLIRALSTAVVFAVVAGLAVNLAAVARAVSSNPELMKEPLANLLWGIAESIVPAILAFPLLTITWILVAFGV